ncbi:MAG: DUF1801 domain-containing protein [Candidatus Dojkabacteria bacterium]
MAIKSEVEKYIAALPEDRKKAILEIRNAILTNLPKGFKETLNHGTIGYVVPHSLYPGGYHCDPKSPLPSINLASKANGFSLYHMGIYADPNLYNWFVDEYKRLVGKNPDIGKSCIRFKRMNEIPLQLIGDLISKVSANDWISQYSKYDPRTK